jgi:hypothetical protein
MQVIYVGDKYYLESGTMSSIYQINNVGFKRTDWGGNSKSFKTRKRNSYLSC